MESPGTGDARAVPTRAQITADKDALLIMFNKLQTDAQAGKEFVTRHKKRPRPGKVCLKTAAALLKDMFPPVLRATSEDARDTPTPWYHVHVAAARDAPLPGAQLLTLGDTRWL